MERFSIVVVVIIMVWEHGLPPSAHITHAAFERTLTLTNTPHSPCSTRHHLAPNWWLGSSEVPGYRPVALKGTGAQTLTNANHQLKGSCCHKKRDLNMLPPSLHKSLGGTQLLLFFPFLSRVPLFVGGFQGTQKNTSVSGGPI